MSHLSSKDCERFNAKWSVVGQCHIWKGPLDKDGYGTFFLMRKTRRAHRVAYFIAHGPIDDGLVINHTCRNRNCVNPQHLKAITKYENVMKDSCSLPYINSQKTHCSKGHPYDRKYGKQRYCSICEAEKRKRLREKWAKEPQVKI
jgi:hypothetical protein